MAGLTIDESLVDWDEISSMDWGSLLIGNGFSINIWKRFGYDNLFDLAKGDVVDTPLSVKELALFEHLDSTNFEDVLRVLYHAKIVDEQLGNPQKVDINNLYKNTKNSLDLDILGDVY